MLAEIAFKRQSVSERVGSKDAAADFSAKHLVNFREILFCVGELNFSQG